MLALFLPLLLLPSGGTALAAPTTTYLSDRAWVSATSGWGPVEKDRSNNENQGRDGAPLRIAGTTYGKGLGVHADSDVRYALGGVCTAFAARVGVDDEIAPRGTVTFQVWLDGAKAYDSGTMRGGQAAKAVNVAVTGKSELRLVVGNAGDGYGSDHADWADAKLTCDTGGQPTPSPTPAPSTAPAGRPTILNSYVLTGPQPDYNLIRYRPRGFVQGSDPDLGGTGATITDPGAYAGWDVLNTPNREISRVLNNPDWVTLRLNRPATVAIVWRGGGQIPGWLAGWTQSGTVGLNGGQRAVYKKSVGAGDTVLGAVYDTPDWGPISRDTYFVLFSEADGTPGGTPAVPSGREVPRPNQPCPAWVHDQYTAPGPDGRPYPTWHAQIDPIYWCNFGHEHGSNPATFDPNYANAFGYVGITMGMVEAHPGFKDYVFDDGVGHMWLLSHHFGTGTLAGACARYHELDVAVRDKASGELLADLRYMVDHGASMVNSTGEPLNPPGCANQGAIRSNGERRLVSAADGAVGYEPWRIDGAGLLGLTTAGLTFNTPDPVVMCNNRNCDTPIPTGNTGSFRFFAFDDGFGVTASGGASGVFYTDGHGQQLVAAGSSGAIKQYIKPGLNLRIRMPNRPQGSQDTECYDTQGWGRPYNCGPDPLTGNPAEREDSLGGDN